MGRGNDGGCTVSRRLGHTLGLLVTTLVMALPLAACGSTTPSESTSPDATPSAAPSSPGAKGLKTIYLAGGCFWGLEKYVALVHGVAATEVGYANGTKPNATYEDGSGYAEAVKVVYDPKVAPLPFLLSLYYDAIDPTTVDRQGNDFGTEYRTGIYYTDPADRAVIEKSLADLQKQYKQPIAIESGPLTAYTRAEDYHQDYLQKNPGGYCHIPQKLFEAAAAARPK
jgi:methionine-S-sulfoxide reductase